MVFLFTSKLVVIIIRGDYFWFGLVFIKKNNQIEFIYKKQKPVQTDLFKFGLFFWQKPVQTDLFKFGLFFWQKPVQTGLSRFFPAWLGFFVSVWFLLKKVTKPKLFLNKKTETGSNQPVSVRCGFLKKTGSNRFGSVFPVWLGFFQFGFGSVFSVSGL